MSTLALASLDQYLGHTSHPDCEYVDGHLVERNLGEISRVPDVVVVRGGRPNGRIITSPPEIAVEVLKWLVRQNEVSWIYP